VSSVFASNALLSYGFELSAGFRRDGACGLPGALALTLVNCLAAGLLWCFRLLVLSPFGIERLDLLVYVLLALPLLKVVSRVAAGAGDGFLARIGESADELVLSSLVFGIALVASRGGFGLPEALLAGAASGLGYWLAVVALDALRERLELSDLPAALKGPPSMLISAGLMAMAFMGVDAIFVKNLAG